MADVTTIDLYEVTMAMSYLRERMSGPATFSLFVRDLPPRVVVSTSTPWTTWSAPARRSTPTPSAPASMSRPTPPSWTPPTKWWSTTDGR